MDTVQVTWTSYFDEPLLYTFCTSESGDPVLKTQDSVEPFNGSHAVVLDWTDAGPPCWFNLRRNDSSNYGSNSDGWDYEFSQRAQTTLGPEPSRTATQGPLSESTSSSVASSTASVSSFNAPVAPASDPSSFNSGLSTGALAGIGVGVGLAGIVISVLVVMMWMRRPKNPSTESKNPSDSDDDSSSTEPYARSEGGAGQHQLHSDLPPAESPTTYSQSGYKKRLWLRDML
ncbi:hypothetical protein DL764_002678 [Monosporascus ibericus]|uniref:Mid2 domain-containing protein n=1 Tax=Monosporascus ibericus TaxID=155417 RepID=A0A4Q4TJB8_9PEZI|nr:hypothetical protein DL764_002678 [Monosporascus ibericus]